MHKQLGSKIFNSFPTIIIINFNKKTNFKYFDNPNSVNREYTPYDSYLSKTNFKKTFEIQTQE